MIRQNFFLVERDPQEEDEINLSCPWNDYLEYQMNDTYMNDK